ncbi:hypothetical protein O6H91_08G015000 [Diphasiastrum complanatum]|uniref:Uncharacterized protein n=1 Tax=Diphasiastrum complanatum TaxID=34168 RepID=A0ACC2CV69_DIPCM|nr:hypothetical protein O6H91_08G015000 [Diphasiastrum complanatum]
MMMIEKRRAGSDDPSTFCETPSSIFPRWSIACTHSPGQSVASSNFNNKVSSSQLRTNLEDESSEDDAVSVIEDRGAKMSLFSGEVQRTTNKQSDGIVQTVALRQSGGDAEVSTL